MKDSEFSNDDASTDSYREEQGRKPAVSGGTKVTPGIGTIARGAVGAEGGDEASTGSPGGDADRAAAEDQSGAAKS